MTPLSAVNRNASPAVLLACIVGLTTAAIAACGASDEPGPAGAAGASGTGGAVGGASGKAGSAGTTAGGGGAAGQGGSAAGAAGTSGNAGTGGGTAGSAGASGTCDPFGHFGVPTVTFTLPKPTGSSMSLPDIQKSFPAVDWANLDRLYVPAGQYQTFQIGNLPLRESSKPLVITNIDGQVKIGPNLGGNYIWSIGGGSGWVLTGRYDPDSKTGDAGFPGHRCGAYADSRGTYGFVSDDALDKSGPYLHMGLSVADATDFEIEYVEVTRSGFAGIRLLNKREANGPEKPMANVRVHDTYVHDVAGEGFYFGWTGSPPSNPMPGLQVYNNRLIRTGNEALQIQQLGEGSHVHHNVMAFAALHWLDNDLGPYQDNNAQVHTRAGTILIEKNVFVGGAGTLLSFFSGPESGDAGRNVTFQDNYFAESSDLAGYLNGTSGAESSYTFKNNFISRLVFGYDKVEPTATPPSAAFGVNGKFASPVLFEANTWDFDLHILPGIAGTDGTSGLLTAKGNTKGAVAPLGFVNAGYPAGAPVRALTVWSALATRAPGSPVIHYKPGDVVMDDAELYRCTADSENEPPRSTPAKWEKLALPADDVRVAPGSPYASMGVQ
jgi:hypothetical protein